MAARHGNTQSHVAARTPLAVGVGILALAGAKLGGVALELLAEAARATTTNLFG